jgi:hypothetical protein
MRSGRGLRYAPVAASLRSSTLAVSVRWGNDPRFVYYREAMVGLPASFRLQCSARLKPCAFSPFVPAANDSESSNADPSGTSLALSDRLAGDQPDYSLHAGRGSLRALPAPARTLCRTACWSRWCLVGYRHRCLARWPRPATSSRTGLCFARGDPHDAQACVSCDRAPQSRPDLQRAAMAQSRRALSALPHDSRCARASPAPMVECLSPPRSGRSFHWSIQLAPFRRSNRGQGGNSCFRVR